MYKQAKIIFIGGPGTGKTETIQVLWGVRLKEDKNIVVSDDIPGRGEITFSVVEMPSVAYSLKGYSIDGNWFNDEIVKIISEADAIVFVLTANSYGYDNEFKFLTELLYKHIIKKDIPFIIGISMIEKLKDRQSRNYGGVISGVYEIERYVINMFKRYGVSQSLTIDNIVPFSAAKGFNIPQLKAKIWDGVISHTNDIIFDRNAPTLIVTGKRGCGKSSTLNVLFGLNLPVDKAVACTKYPRVMQTILSINGKQVKLNVVDLPGIAESIKADMDYYPFYKKYVERANVLLCINQANVRAYKQDEIFYKHLSSSGILSSKTSIVIAMNHTDSLFKNDNNPDGVDLDAVQEDNPILNEKIDDMFERNYKHFFFASHSDISKDCVIPISASCNWHIDLLKNKIISKLK